MTPERDPKTGRFLSGNSGKPKGAKNRATVVLRDAILESFDELGGVEWLVKVGRRYPRAFMQLLGRTLPLEVKADIGENLAMVILREYSGLTAEQRQALDAMPPKVIDVEASPQTVEVVPVDVQ